jgi:two-component system chemotaxis response regulator CheY
MTTLNALDVLIVDDHEAMRTLLARVLTKAGISKVRAAANGADALAMLASQPATLILADQNMPQMDGLTFIASVRAQGAAARIIMISGSAGAAQRAAATAAGADAVLMKPISPRDLLTAIETLFAV